MSTSSSRSASWSTRAPFILPPKFTFTSTRSTSRSVSQKSPNTFLGQAWSSTASPLIRVSLKVKPPQAAISSISRDSCCNSSMVSAPAVASST